MDYWTCQIDKKPHWYKLQMSSKWAVVKVKATKLQFQVKQQHNNLLHPDKKDFNCLLGQLLHPRKQLDKANFNNIVAMDHKFLTHQAMLNRWSLFAHMKQKSKQTKLVQIDLSV